MISNLSIVINIKNDNYKILFNKILKNLIDALLY